MSVCFRKIIIIFTSNHTILCWIYLRTSCSNIFQWFLLNRLSNMWYILNWKIHRQIINIIISSIIWFIRNSYWNIFNISWFNIKICITLGYTIPKSKNTYRNCSKFTIRKSYNNSIIFSCFNFKNISNSWICVIINKIFIIGNFCPIIFY